MSLSGKKKIYFITLSQFQDYKIMDGQPDDGFDDGDGWDETLAQINLDLQEREKPPASTVSSSHKYTFKNVTVDFPYPAYKSQRQMMGKIIEGVTTGENCLLESPTGTGKRSQQNMKLLNCCPRKIILCKTMLLKMYFVVHRKNCSSPMLTFSMAK